MYQAKCKRCGKVLWVSRRSLLSPLGCICEGCITEEEVLAILKEQARRYL